MKILFENNSHKNPLVSIILLDWSVRESFHIFDYLDNQTVPRDRYEIIWIEYYKAIPKSMEEKIEKSLKEGRPILDTWIIVEMPRDIHYHKHLMYNMGIIATSGEIITFCDSDAIVKPTFVESIINAFDKEQNMVLHMDEVRSIDKTLYPFCYPTIERIEEKGCINIQDGKPVGFEDKSDPLHKKNYGACMSALKKDLINIGGADEHIDYLGNICGPYEMTFRLKNYGKREVWHQKEWLYHTWHPGQGGRENFLGPHDRGMSKTSLNSLITKRVEPLAENPAIRLLRTEEGCDRNHLLSEAIPKDDILKGWESDIVNRRMFTLSNIRYYPLAYLKILPVLFRALSVIDKKNDPVLNLGKFLKKNVEKDLKEESAGVKRSNSIIARLIRLVWKILKWAYWRHYFIYRYNKAAIENCWHFFYNHLIPDKTKEIALFGISDIAKIIIIIAKQTGIRIAGIYDNAEGLKFSGYMVSHYMNLKDYQGKILISSAINIEEKAGKLKALGIKEKNILVM
ncbi:MAG: glycosyltransferase [Planctomycetes bacterium]|nr:glycosyltransferase [Planctomycetota bacterium]